MYRYSNRLAWPFFPDPYNELVNQIRRQGAPLFDLTVSNPTKASLTYPHQAIGQAIGSTGDYLYDPDPLGLPEAREAVVGYYADRDIQVSRDQIVLTASTSEAYSLLFKLLCDPGHQVLAARPSYPLFEYLSALECVQIVPYWLRFDGSWFIDFTHLEQQITPKVRALVVVNPNNPTGSFLKASELAQLAEVVLHHALPVISDEVFMDYALNTIPAASASKRVSTLIGNSSFLSFSLGGLSKAAGMPQMKLAWIVINGPPIDVEAARNRLELMLDTYLSVNTPVQRALSGLLAIGEGIQQQLRERILGNYEFLLATLHNSVSHCLHLEGGWSAILQLPRTQSDDQWRHGLLAAQGVIVQPGFFFDIDSEACLVVSLITEPTTFREGITRLAQYQSKP